MKETAKEIFEEPLTEKEVKETIENPGSRKRS